MSGLHETLSDWKFITFFTYHLDVFENVPNVIVRSFRRLSKFSFNITVVIKVPISRLFDDDFTHYISDSIEDIYSSYVKSDRFKREEYENVNQMVDNFLIKYPNLR